MRKTGDINNLYDFQDLDLLSEVYESRANLMHRIYRFNPGTCTSAVILSGWMYLDEQIQSYYCIANFALNSSIV